MPPVGLAALIESGERILPQRLEQPVPAGLARYHGRDERLLDEPRQQIEYVALFDDGVGHDDLRRLEAEVGGEHRQPHEHLPLGIGEEVVTPRDHRFERALARSQEPESVVEARRDLFE